MRRKPAESLEDLQTGDREVNSWVFCWVTNDQGLNIVEGLAPSEMEKEIHHGVGGGNVGALSIWIVFPLFWGKKRDDDCTPGQTGTLRREQREWLERSHCRKN
jgi:hypothetical protein